ncbi:MAG: phosphoglycerate transporter [Chloroflexi bacterium]|nr:phosphoglycerate transporter [Chloroflexota bacterium]
MNRIGWFSTGRDGAARELLISAASALEKGDIAGHLEFVLCNREPGESPESDLFLELVRRYRIPLVMLSSRRFWQEQGQGQPYAAEKLPPWRRRYDQEVLRLLEPFSPDLVVLAGYMLIVSPTLCQAVPMINLHPAAPGGPTGTWQEVIWRLIEARAASSGVMMHLVTPDLDRGPAITYCTYPLRGGVLDALWSQVEGKLVVELRESFGEGLPLFQAIRQRGLAREFPLIVSTLRACCQGRFRLGGGQIVDGQGHPVAPVDLTPEVEASLAGGEG